jgi:hypothetical protein
LLRQSATGILEIVDAGPNGRRPPMPAATPALERRRLARAATWGLALVLLVWLVGSLVTRARVGSSDVTTLGQVANEVRDDFAALAAELETTTAQVAATRDARRPSGPDNSRARALFDTTAALITAHGRVDAISVYDPVGQPVAWAGRPSNLPDVRVLGPETLFVTPGPAGLRLVHVRPITDESPENRRIGSVAAEHLLTRDATGSAGTGTSFTLETSLVPVSLRPRYESGDSVPPYGFLLSAPGGTPLLDAEVTPASLQALRASWHADLDAVLLSVVAIVLLVLAAIVRESQERSRDRQPYLLLTALLVTLLVAARLLLAFAVPAAWRLPTTSLLGRLLLRSAADHLATSLVLLALVVLLADLVERWRLARHARIRRVAATPWSQVAFWSVHVAVAFAIGWALVFYEHVLAAIVRNAGTVGLRFSLHPFDVSRRRTGACDDRRSRSAARWPCCTSVSRSSY